jgi:4-amino-4-deoxy-L-arabinose transferase-like glycosyltransferase
MSVATGGEFLRFAVGKEIMHRVMQDMEAHGGFPGYYPAISALAFYPWSALMPAALLAAWQRRKLDPNLGFLLGWVIGPLVVLECLRTKLVHYYLPAIPACALLTSWLIVRVAAEGVNIRRKPLGRLAIAILVGIGLLGVVLVGSVATMAGRPFALPLVLIAAVLAGGTLVGASLLQQGVTERAANSLAATWAIVLLIATTWLIPLAEPYRTSRVLGEKLAAISTRLAIEPVLLEYQEPGVMYSLGRPVATTRDRDGFFAHLVGGKSVLTVVLPSEIDVMRGHFGLDVTAVDQVEGFNMAKGKKQTFQLALVRERTTPSPADALEPNTRRIGLKLENALVK